jgi:integrase
VVGRYDERYDWRYVVRSLYGPQAGVNLDRRGETWRYRRTLPGDIRDRAGQVEFVRGLGRLPLADALARTEHLNAQLEGIIELARCSRMLDVRKALSAVGPGGRTAGSTPEASLVAPFCEHDDLPRADAFRPGQSPSPMLSAALDHYEREQWAAGKWKAEKAGHAAMAELRRFLHHVGDLPVAEITREDVRSFRDRRGETLRASTLNIKVMSRLVSFFRHCHEEGWMAKLPTKGLRVRDPIANRDKRRTFTLAELQRVFGPGWKRECKGDDHKFLCGRLLLATGARAEEIAQLRIEDVRIEKRLVSIRITDEYPEQRLKNTASRRVVPLHSVVAPSFRRYVCQVEREGHEWVFHRWSRTPTQPRSSPIVTTFGVYLRKKCGITDRRVVLHSLRHTVKQLLQEAGAPDSLISDLLGHAGQGQTNGTYGDAATVERMAEWVECLPLARVLNGGRE